MKIIIITLMLAAALKITNSQPEANSLIPKIDERVELISIAFMLSGMEELNDSLNPHYREAIYNHFSKFPRHKLIIYLDSLWTRLKNDSIEFGYWDAPAIAIHLSQPPELKLLVPLVDSANTDPWDNRSLLTEELILLIREFYRDTDCESFFKSQKPYYEKIQNQYEKDGIKLNKQWINEYYSVEPNEKYYAVIALCLRNGAYLRVNYRNEVRDTYTIFGCTDFDKNGIPTTFNEQYFPLSMLHEYLHCFVNQLVEKYSGKLRQSAETILFNPKVFELMKNTFYGNWRYLLYESLVRACSIKYKMEHIEDKSLIEKDFKAQEKAGFFWMRELVELFEKYYSNRGKYPDMDTFMPVVVKYFSGLAETYK